MAACPLSGATTGARHLNIGWRPTGPTSRCARAVGYGWYLTFDPVAWLGPARGGAGPCEGTRTHGTNSGVSAEGYWYVAGTVYPGCAFQSPGKVYDDNFQRSGPRVSVLESTHALARNRPANATARRSDTAWSRPAVAAGKRAAARIGAAVSSLHLPARDQPQA